MSSDTRRQAILSAVARLLREARLKKELSLSEVGASAGISYQMVALVEKERRNPTLDTLLRIADALKVDFVKTLAEADQSARKQISRKRN